MPDLLRLSELQITSRKESPLAGVGLVDIEKGWVQVLYLVPEAIGLGLGKALLNRLEQEAAIHGRSMIGLKSTVTARAFYESQGYRNLGEEPHRGAPSYRMEEALI